MQADKSHTPLRRINHEFSFQHKAGSWDWSCVGDKQRHYLSLPEPALKGEHQYRNAASVLMAVTEMEDVLPVTEQSIHAGLRNIQLKARFQLIEGNISVLLDVAHNPQAVQALFDYLQSDFAGKKIHAVFAMMKDKDIVSVIEIIRPVIKDWFIAPLNNPRAADELQMQDCFRCCGINDVTFGFKDFSEAYVAAENRAEKGDLIVVFGSFFLVSEYLTRTENT